jgi:hypothetical protein
MTALDAPCCNAGHDRGIAIIALADSHISWRDAG